MHITTVEEWLSAMRRHSCLYNPVERILLDEEEDNLGIVSDFFDGSVQYFGSETDGVVRVVPSTFGLVLDVSRKENAPMRLESISTVVPPQTLVPKHSYALRLCHPGPKTSVSKHFSRIKHSRASYLATLSDEEHQFYDLSAPCVQDYCARRLEY